jgi:Tfp pilus assembly protein PilO
MTFNPSIDFNTIIQAFVALVAVLGFIYAIKGKLDNLVQRIEDKFDTIDKDVAAIRDLLTTQIRQDSRLNRLEEQMAEVRKDVRELRHGDGFINLPKI